ncbi:MAG: substrate-binding domain-containing protein [Thermoguttaceae bacterium]|jgi:LacI family transcriptional regulator
MSRQRPKQVAVAIPIAVPWMAECLGGILEYAREHGGWNVLTSPPTLIGAMELTLTAASLRGWPGDGVIAFINNRKEASDAKRLGIPVVTLGGVLCDPSLPRVMVDHYAIGRVAADHLLQCGFRRLAFYGIRGPWYARQRRQGFVDRAAEANVACHVLEQVPSSNPRTSWRQRLAPLDKWLRSLKLPAGIMAVHDYRARILLEECLRLELHVPHDVAIVGVDNDTTVCEHCQPALSSVSRNSWTNGYEAALLLGRLMAGETPQCQEIILPPDGVVARRSTDTIAVDDPYVSAVVHYMHDHLAEISQVTDALTQVSVSRRFLEQRFLASINCTPYHYLCGLRVERAKRMLMSPERPKMHAVARACGFPSTDRMRLVFLRHMGKTPSEFRQHG